MNTIKFIKYFIFVFGFFVLSCFLSFNISAFSDSIDWTQFDNNDILPNDLENKYKYRITDNSSLLNSGDYNLSDIFVIDDFLGIYGGFVNRDFFVNVDVFVINDLTELIPYISRCNVDTTNQTFQCFLFEMRYRFVDNNSVPCLILNEYTISFTGELLNERNDIIYSYYNGLVHYNSNSIFNNYDIIVSDYTNQVLIPNLISINSCLYYEKYNIDESGRSTLSNYTNLLIDVFNLLLSPIYDVDIIFDSNGGIFVDEMDYFYQTLLPNVTLPLTLTQTELNDILDIALPTKADANFLGWSVSSNVSYPVDFITINSNSITLYAVWQQTGNYNAYFYNFDNSLWQVVSVPYDYVWVNTDYVNSNMPTLNSFEYIFEGWQYSRDLGDTIHTDFISIEQSTEDIYFYPKYFSKLLNGGYTSNGFFTLGSDGQTLIEPFNSEINFTSNAQHFSRMKFSFNDNTYYLYYDDLLVAYQSRISSDYIHWTNLNYSNIVFNEVYAPTNNFYRFITYNFYLGSISVSDITGYYYFNVNPIGTNSSNNTFRFLFISNGQLFNSLTILSNGSILYDGELVYNGDTQEWVNEKFRLININYTQVEEEQMQILLSNGVFSYIDVNGDYDFTDVLFSVADIPVRIMSQLLDVSIFGVSLFTALCGIITILLVAFVIKKFL